VKRVRHYPALPWPDIPVFVTALVARDGIAAQALYFAILTAARVGEVRGMRWRELDLEARVWVVPGHRMKSSNTHRVPLSHGALAVLAEVRPLMKSADDLVFPGWRQGRPLSDRAISEVVRRMNEQGNRDEPLRWRDAEGRAVVPHGFRSSFRDWCGETRAEGREVVEAALAHSIRDKAEAAYARSDLLEKRRPLMNAWAELCVSRQGKVVALKGAFGGPAPSDPNTARHMNS
jgi:integrase